MVQEVDGHKNLVKSNDEGTRKSDPKITQNPENRIGKKYLEKMKCMVWALWELRHNLRTFQKEPVGEGVIGGKTLRGQRP